MTVTFNALSTDVEAMDPIQWADDHWLALYFGFDAVLFGASILLWNPGTRPISGLLFVIALLLPLAFLAVRFTNRLLESAPEEPRRRRSA